MKLLTGATIVLLAGCAASSPVKLVMEDSQYRIFAAQLIGPTKCVEAGLLDPATAARGQTYATNDLAEYTYNPVVLQQAIDRLSKSMPTAQDCSRAAVAIEQRHQQIMRNSAAAAADTKAWNDVVNSTRPRQPVYCNSIGTQTICQ